MAKTAKERFEKYKENHPNWRLLGSKSAARRYFKESEIAEALDFLKECRKTLKKRTTEEGGNGV